VRARERKSAPAVTPDPSSAYKRAIARLARRDHSEGEVRRALLEEGHGKEEVEDVISRLRSRRLLDDEAFALRFARRGFDRHYGRNHLRSALAHKGLAPSVVERGLKEALAQRSEAEGLEEVAQRYWRQRASDDPPLRMRKLWGFLVRRGFPSDLVLERLRVLWPSWRDALDDLDDQEPPGATPEGKG